MEPRAGSLKAIVPVALKEFERIESDRTPGI